MLAILAAGALVCAQAAAAGGQGPTAPAGHLPGAVRIVVMPPETSIDDLATVPGVSLGVMSTGIGDVSREQTYLDISQGNRVDDVLYDRALPRIRGVFLRIPRWSQILRRADSVPADLVPGLLGSTLLEAGIRPEPFPGAGTAALMVADRAGEVGRVVGGPPAVIVLSAGIGPLRKAAITVPPGGLLIAFSEPSAGRKAAPIGIIGAGFQHRSLTSDSTRTDGYVLSTDVAATILRRFGLPIPDEMDGKPIRPDGAADAAAVSDLVDRMAAIPDRREPVLIACILAWLLVGFAFGRVVFRLRRVAMAWLGLCFAYMPLMLLAGAWLEPGALAEGLLVGVGAALLAALTVRFVPGWPGLAAACGISVIAYSVDVSAGSGLTRLSLLGPNPIFGARFYGIGNELEALFAVMVPVGVAAGLTSYRGRDGTNSGRGRGVSRGAAIAAFLVAGAAGAVVFGAGSLGADVGAAIVLPVGAVVAAAMIPADLEHSPGRRPGNRTRFSRGRLAAAVVGAPLIALALLALVDLVSGTDSHLARSVLDAGGGNLADVARRRIELSAHDFAGAAGNPLFWVVVAGMGVALAKWRRIDAWIQPAPIARAGLLGACAAVAVGVLVNDSGATFLVLGALALGAFLAYAWAQAGGDRYFPA